MDLSPKLTPDKLATLARMQWCDQWRDLLWIVWIIVKCAIVAGIVLICGRALELLSLHLFVNAASNWSVSVVRVLSDVFAMFTFICLAVRDIWIYFF
jgi:hypothetical protein